MKNLVLILIVSMALGVSTAAQQQQTILGKTDLTNLLHTAPTMPETAGAALARAYGPDPSNPIPNNLDTIYLPFFKQVTQAQQSFQRSIAELKKTHPEEAFQKQFTSNPMVTSMGGVDKVKQMSPGQLNQAVQQSASQSIADMGGGTGMQGMAQAMNDPAYRARFKKMSQAEKQAEVMKYMNSGPPTGQTPEQQQKAQQQLQANAQIKTTGAQLAALTNALTQMRQRLAAVDAEFTQKDQAITNSQGSHKEIAYAINTKINNLPLIDMGELGKDHDPALEDALHREQADLDHKRASWELQQRAALYVEYVSKYEEVANNYLAWVRQNSNWIDPTMQLMVANYESDLLNLPSNLGSYTKNVTGEVAGYEKKYRDEFDSRKPTVNGKRSMKKQ